MLNIVMSIMGLALIISLWLKRNHIRATNDTPMIVDERNIGWRKAAFVSILLFSLTMPSDWTQDVPARYGLRHDGLTHSKIYPKIDTAPKEEKAALQPTQ